jgi:2-hydroxychromene-2-carboxylate isomerase
MTPEVDFYFDYISPYAYLAWCELRRRDPGFVVRPRPVLFAALLDHHGQLGPAEIEPKRRFVFRDVTRRAIDAGVAVRPPVMHPFNPLAALRVSLASVAGDAQLAVIDALFSATWMRAVPVDSGPAVARVLEDAGLDGETLVARTTRDDVKAALRTETDVAIARGVFGVPTFVVDGEPFWGSDQLAFVKRAVEGHDPAAPLSRTPTPPPGTARRRGLDRGR